MKNTMISSFDKLPTEILHRIFDFLTASTILFNIRPVSRRFRSLAVTYIRYKIDSQSISTTQFYRTCRLIQPENVISLFLSGICSQPLSIDLSSYNRLQSIGLVDIDENQIQNSIFSQLNLQGIESLKLTIRKYDDHHIEQTREFVNWLFTGPRLRQVEIHLLESRFSTVVYTKNDTVEYLTLHTVNDINRLSILLESFPNLHTLILKRVSFSILKLSSKCFPQLKSLSIEQFNGAIDRLEPFLLWTPGLTHLKIRGEENTFDAKRWEEFVQIHLTQLTSFDFDFSFHPGITLKPDDFIEIFKPFQSSFWLEEKKWFITCSHLMSYWSSVHLCSSPMNSTTSSSSSHTFDSEPSIINNENELNLSIDDTFLRHLDEQKTNGDLPFFPSVNKLKLKFLEQNFTHSMETIWSMIDISRLEQIELEDNGIFRMNDQTLIELKTICERAVHLSVLVLHLMFDDDASTSVIENIISILPPHLGYLNMPITTDHQIKLVENRCRNLMSIRMVGRPEKLYAETTFASDQIDLESDPNLHL